MAKPKILLVTSDVELRDKALDKLSERFEFTALDNAKDALAALEKDSGFDVLATGLSLPGVGGIELLDKVQERFPKVTRMIVTGEGNFDVALDAVNKNHVFSFITKPCPSQVLSKALDEAVQHSVLQKAEAELIRKTLFGCVNMLVSILELTSPEAIGRGTRIKERVKNIGRDLKAGPGWMLEMSALLSHIGCVGLPKGVLDKLETGQDFTKAEVREFVQHPAIAAQLLSNIPRMDKLARIIRHQYTPCKDNPPLISRILRVCLDLDHLERKKVPAAKALEAFIKKPHVYDAKVVESLTKLLSEDDMEGCLLTVADLLPGMVMLADMVTKEGAKLLLKGQTLSEISHLRLLAFAHLLGVKEPICAMMPQ